MNAGWGPFCSKCGHPAVYHGTTFCQVDAGGPSKKRCDCDGYLPSDRDEQHEASVLALQYERDRYMSRCDDMRERNARLEAALKMVHEWMDFNEIGFDTPTQNEIFATAVGGELDTNG